MDVVGVKEEPRGWVWIDWSGWEVEDGKRTVEQSATIDGIYELMLSSHQDAFDFFDLEKIWDPKWLFISESVLKLLT